MADRANFDEFIESKGGLEQLYRDCDDYDRRFDLLCEQLLDLIKQRPKQWVALCEGDVWVFADSHQELLQEVRSRGLRTQFAAIMHLDPSPPILLLSCTV